MLLRITIQQQSRDAKGKATWETISTTNIETDENPPSLTHKDWENIFTTLAFQGKTTGLLVALRNGKGRAHGQTMFDGFSTGGIIGSLNQRFRRAKLPYKIRTEVYRGDCFNNDYIIERVPTLE
ncbi:MAG: hypothetical protein AAB343_00365 [Patescibacteria group bacterium]